MAGFEATECGLKGSGLKMSLAATVSFALDVHSPNEVHTCWGSSFKKQNICLT